MTNHAAKDLRSRIDELSDAPVTSWRPEPGEVLVGTLLDIDVRDTKFEARVPVLTIRNDDNGEIVECWGLHTVLRSELSKKRPQPGERLAIRRLSDSGQGYKRYKVIIDRDGPQAFDWAAVPTDAGDVAPEDRHKLIGQTGDVIELPARKVDPLSGDDDPDDPLPF
jgi:hypothetical protein